MKLYSTIIAAAMAVGMASCSSSNSTSTQSDFEPIPFNKPTNLALAVVDDNAAYNYFTREQWSALDTHVKGAFTPVGVCLFSDKDSIIVSLHDGAAGNKTPLLTGLAQVNSIPKYPEADKALADFDGAANCKAMTRRTMPACRAQGRARQGYCQCRRQPLVYPGPGTAANDVRLKVKTQRCNQGVWRRSCQKCPLLVIDPVRQVV